MTKSTKQEVTIEASPRRVFDALTKGISAWWGAPYLVSETAQDIDLEPKLGGRFYEVWGENEGVLWATVTGIKWGERLELTGPIGMRGPVQAVVSFELEPKGNTTILRLSHQAVGEVTKETEENYGQGWRDLIGTRLKEFVETGKRHGISS